MSKAKTKLRKLKLRETVVSFLGAKNIHTAEDVLSMHFIELLELGLNLEDAETLCRCCSENASPKPITAMELLSNRKMCSTSLPLLDKHLGGGLVPGTITEIAGPAGCGKTQFCMMVAAVVACRNEDGGVIFLDTEGSFTPDRMMKIAEEKFPQVFSSEDRILNLANNVTRKIFETSNDLVKALERLDEAIVNLNANLVILDSAASLLRKEYSTASVERQEIMASQATLLKKWAELFNIPILVTNQVTTRFDDRHGDVMGDAYVTAALGNTWAHSVNTRITVNYSKDSNLRYMNIIKSPLVPQSTMSYTITNSGIEEIAEEEEEEIGGCVIHHETHQQAATTVRIEPRAMRQSTSDQYTAVLDVQNYNRGNVFY
eukprot:m.64755 g.64755  ORF g.64755 m.64755 type:complete len:374 (+) comp8124_c1_seq3:6-1127(+)